MQAGLNLPSLNTTRKYTPSFALVMILLSTSLLCVVASASSVDYSGASQEYRASSHSYSNSLDAAYDGSNSSYALLVVRACEQGSCTSSSFLDAEYLLSSVSTPTILEFEWNIQPYDSFTPSGATTDLSMYNYATTTWSVMSSVTGTLSGWELVNVAIPSAFVNQNNELKLRIGGFHNDEGSSSDELGIWVREFHLYSNDDATSDDADQDGVTDDLDDCPNGESGWTSNATTDNDSDGCQDSGEDLDDDDDGFDDDEDAFPLNALEWADFDGDLIGDNADSDDDNDGYSDAEEEQLGTSPTDDSIFPPDFDGDYTADFFDDDDDNDGIPDEEDKCNRDIGKNWGEREDDTTYSHNHQLDIDFDGCRDSDEDDDDDNDRREDNDDMCPEGDMNWDSNDSEEDFDGDGCRDNSQEDRDDDNDSWDDTTEENCGTDSRDAESVPIDSDGDRICDSLDSSPDSSGTEQQSNDSAETEKSESKSCRDGKTPDKFCDITEMYEAPISLLRITIAFATPVVVFLMFRKRDARDKELESRIDHIEDDVEEIEEQFNEFEHPNV